jgi:cytochrome c-type biogenesis protein
VHFYSGPPMHFLSGVDNRFGAPALAAGVALAFAGLGPFLATAGFTLGLDQGPFRILGVLSLAAFGLVLLVPTLYEKFAIAAGRLSGVVAPLSSGLSAEGPGGQFVLGLILRLVWGPCAGPTLGAASLLAARGRDLPQVGAMMALFALGTTFPLASPHFS